MPSESEDSPLFPDLLRRTIRTEAVVATIEKMASMARYRSNATGGAVSTVAALCGGPQVACQVSGSGAGAAISCTRQLDLSSRHEVRRQAHVEDIGAPTSPQTSALVTQVVEAVSWSDLDEQLPQHAPGHAIYHLMTSERRTAKSIRLKCSTLLGTIKTRYAARSP